MCGIAGIINYQTEIPPDSQAIRKMLEPIQHRGPDDSSFHLSKHNHLGHTRLSIIDVSGGKQPMFSADGDVCVVFNGEIFNYIELKEQYLKDYRFKSHSDTEVVIALYQKMGIDFVKQLNGQFAIALFDAGIQTTYLIRDRVGICPLFYAENGDQLVFASEIKSLLTSDAIPTCLDLPAFSEFIHLWTPLSPHTLFSGISELSPGCMLEINRQGRQLHRYWDFSFQPDKNQTLSEAIQQLEALLTDAVSIRLRSDVPVAAYLSGGLDSTIILSYLKKIGISLNTFSLNFEENGLDEGPYQQEVQAFFNTAHTSVLAENTAIADNFVSCIRNTETPLFRSSPAPMMMLSRQVRQQGFKVVLTGEGSDEIFAGYDIFKEAVIRRFWAVNPDSSWRPLLLRRLYPYLDFNQLRSTEYLKQVFGHNLSHIDDLLYGFNTRSKTTSAVSSFLLDEVRNQLASDMEQRARNSFPIRPTELGVLNTAQYIESKTIMPGYILSAQGDRMLMANSVEGRYPFLDHRVIEFAGNLKNRFKLNGLNEKYILKAMVKGKIPDSVLNRPKQPYRAPDIEALRCSSDNQLLDYLNEDSVKKTGLFNPRKVNMLLNKALKGRTHSVKDNMLFTIILSTQIWMSEFTQSKH